MLQSIKEKNDQINQYFISNFHMEDSGQEYFKAIIQEFNESCRDFNIWFKTQFNEELLVNYMYSRLQMLRALNHDVQSQEIEEKYGMVQISNQLCNFECPELLMIYKYNIFANSSKYLQHSQMLDEELHNLENAFSNQQDISDICPPTKKKYSIEKIVHLYQFELNSLKGYNLKGELLYRLNILNKDSSTIWILGIIDSKIVIQREIKEINDICQQFLDLDSQELIKIEQKQQQEQLSIDSQLSKINTASSIDHYKSQFKQINIPIRKTESQLPKPKSCMCPIY